jgi:chromosome segregation ATPase
MFHDKLEDEKRRYKSDLNEISSASDKALKKRVQWEREASNLKGELNNICEENANYTRQCEALEDKNNRANNDLDSMTNSIGVHRLRINGL